MAERPTIKTKGPRTGLSLWEALRYRGGAGQWAWILHRVTGLGVLFFLILHILDIYMAAFGPAVFNKLLFIYHSVVFKPLIILLIFGVIYHALNGLRLVMFDLWPKSALAQREMWYGAMAISVGVALVSIVVMI
ncbi:MAG: succinate dehydrogenase, cytochrome b556 subunit [Candidatus Bipolaricaulia bacterium]